MSPQDQGSLAPHKLTQFMMEVVLLYRLSAVLCEEGNCPIWGETVCSMRYFSCCINALLMLRDYGESHGC